MGEIVEDQMNTRDILHRRSFYFGNEYYNDDDEWVLDTAKQLSRSDTAENETGAPKSNDMWAESTQPIHSPADSSPHTTPVNTPPGTPISPVTPNSPTPVATPSTASSSTGGDSTRRYRLLTDLYENTDEIKLPPEELMLMCSEEEPPSYGEVSQKKE